MPARLLIEFQVERLARSIFQIPAFCFYTARVKLHPIDLDKCLIGV